jgi:protein O-GlcNAc transferase
MNAELKRVDVMFQSAVSLHREGRASQADMMCEAVLQADPRHFHAYHLRGLIALKLGDIERGVDFLERSLAINPQQPAAHSNIGNAWLGLGRPQQALESFERALHLKPDYVIARFNRGNALKDLGQFERALECYDAVLVLEGRHVQALNNRGLVLQELGRLEEALACFERATTLDARYCGAMANRAAVLMRLKRPTEALEAFESTLKLVPTDATALRGRAGALAALERRNEAYASLTQALEVAPESVETLILRGNLAEQLHRSEQALADYGQASRIAPDSVLALKASAGVMLSMGRAATSLAQCERARQLAPEDPDILCGQGAALLELGRREEAGRAFADVLRVQPGHRAALGQLFSLRMASCEWQDYESQIGRLGEALGQSDRFVNPPPLMFFDQPELSQTCARGFVAARYGPDAALGPFQPASSALLRRKIRIAYVSADFTDHPVSQLLVGVLERHDRERFEIIGISLRAGGGGLFERRVRTAFDRCIDVAARSDVVVAALMREENIDIAVDLMGFTDGLRLGIFARRAAPVQVSYLGYAATLGAPYMDYLLADEVVIPAGMERCYSEQVVRLPSCYLPNDAQREIGPRPTRAQAALPHQGLVFCAFTQTQKINPPMFDVWMSLLREIEGSVLWLRDMGVETRDNLQREARARGVTPERLVFAPRVPDMAGHLGRHGLADLYLDTLPYNAHSTACDALWSGVPVLTCAGRGFASRVAASALTTLGLPELITHSLEDYQHRALELARDPEQLLALRCRLEQRQVTPARRAGT